MSAAAARGRSGGLTRRPGFAVRAGVLVVCALLVLPGPALGASTPAPPLDSVVVANPGPGFSVASQGPLDAPEFASSSPDPSATSSALAALDAGIASYERVWVDRGHNEVQDVVLRFPTARRGRDFLQAVQHALASGKIVSSGALPGVPGARSTTYFAATTPAGIGESVTMMAGDDVDLLSFFSAATADARPITPVDAKRVAQAQDSAILASAGGTSSAAPADTTRKGGISAGAVGAAAVAVAVLAAAVATPALLRRRRSGTDPTSSPVHHRSST